MSKQEVHSETHCFDPAEYVRLFHNGGYENVTRKDKEIMEWAKDKIHTLLAGGKYRGEHLLDIGSGPVAYTAIVASEWFDKIYLSDLSPANVEFLKKWIRGESEHMKYLMQFYALKDGKQSAWEEKNRLVRKKVKDAVVCDMTKPDFLYRTVLHDVQIDVVTACLCMGCADSTIEGYTGIIQNIRKMLKPGGHLIVVDIMDQIDYVVQNKKFRLFVTNEQEIKTAFTESGFQIENFGTNSLPEYPEAADFDPLTGYFITAKKL